MLGCSSTYRLARLALLTVAGSLLGLWAAPAAAQWPIKTFQVVNVEPAGQMEGNRNLHSIARAVVRLIRAAGGDPDFPAILENPDFPGIFETVPLAPETRADIESLLNQSASVLEGWGFPPPALQPVVDVGGGRQAYRVYVVSELDEAAGVYHPNPCDSVWDDETVILLHGGEVLRDGRLSPFGASVVVHELFHAVQGATPFFRECDRSAGNWITEGQASAVGWDLARLIRPLDSSQLARSRERAIGLRDYSDRLPVPEYRSEKAYRTASFWRYLAERASASGAGAMLSSNLNLVDYTYLARFLQQRASARDCSETGDPCRAEIEWLDIGLRAVFRERLRDVYPRFIEAYVGYSGGRWAALGGLPFVWRGLSFDHGCLRIVLRPHSDSLQATDVMRRFDPVSAQCWQVHLEGFEEETVEVAVTARGPRTVAQLEQLTAVVPEDAGGATHVDTAAVIQPLDLPSTTWYYTLPNGDSTLILLTNVAHTPAATRPLPGLNVSFTAIRSIASMAPGESGPTPAEIDDTLPIELEWMSGHVFPTPSNLASHPEECTFRFSGWKRGEVGRGRDALDSIELQLNHVGPIGVGSYGVRAADDPRFMPPEDAVGWFIGGFQIGEGNILADGHAQGFWLQSGSIQITSVTGRLVRGIVAVTGWRNTCCLPGPRIGEHYGRPSLTLAARFSFFANERSPGNSHRMNERTSLACLEQPAPEAGPPPTPGPDHPETDQPDPNIEPDSEPGPQDDPGTEPERDPEIGEWNPPPAVPTPDAETEAPPDPTEAPGNPAQDPRPSEDSTGEVEGGFVERVTVRVTGDVDTTLTFRGDAVVWSGGCDGRSRLSLGFRGGQPGASDWVSLGFDTEGVVATAQTGAFALDEVRLDHGTRTHSTGGRTIQVPNRFGGTGTLSLIVHDATMASRRMTGTVAADGLINDEGLRARVEAEFDLRLSCGMAP